MSFWDSNGGAGGGSFRMGASGGSKGSDFYAYGDTNTRYLWWDASADRLYLFGELYHQYGDVTFNQNAGTPDFRVESTGLAGAILVDGGDNQIVIGSDEITSAAESLGTDVNIFVSGTIGSKDTATKGTSLFAGDLVTSGTIYAGAFGPTPTGGTLSLTASMVDVGWDPSGGSADLYPTLRLSSKNTTINSGEGLGTIEFWGDDTDNAGVGAKIVAQADSTWSGAGDYPTNLEFWTAEDGASAARRMIVQADGNVGINVDAPSMKLHISGAASESVAVRVDGPHWQKGYSAAYIAYAFR